MCVCVCVCALDSEKLEQEISLTKQKQCVGGKHASHCGDFSSMHIVSGFCKLFGPLPVDKISKYAKLGS